MSVSFTVSDIQRYIVENFQFYIHLYSPFMVDKRNIQK